MVLVGLFPYLNKSVFQTHGVINSPGSRFFWQGLKQVHEEQIWGLYKMLKVESKSANEQT